MSVQPANPTDRVIRLKSELCDYLIDIPEMIIESSRLVVAAKNPQGLGGLRPRVARLKARVSSMKQSLETWFGREVEPDLFAGPSSKGQEEERSIEYSGPGLLRPVFDCVVNSTLMVFERMTRRLECLEGMQASEADFPSIDYIRRRRRVETAYSYVKMRSAVCSKPLELGLRQLSAADEGLNAALKLELS